MSALAKSHPLRRDRPVIIAVPKGNLPFLEILAILLW